MRYATTVIFGGTGFIGRHFAGHLLAENLSRKIYLCDIVPPDRDVYPRELNVALDDGSVEYLEVDVRKPVDASALPATADLVVNLAAIHREPGHEPAEYFETNVLGAENVCAWAASARCETLVFTSSIAPYGPTEHEKTEESLPVPETPYGGSKLVAEKIQIGWQQAEPDRRRLLIVRPGVVFGPGEGGNVSRLIRAVLGRYFFYMGNRETRKAGGYVKELCHTIVWALERQKATGQAVSLYNFTMTPTPTVEQYVAAICSVAGVRRFVPPVPYGLLFILAGMIEIVARPLRIEHPFSPVRIRKLVRSNNIRAGYLTREGYPVRYTLEQALADWREERPDEWGVGP
jgi:nucleoside-diphosphate-sugar epimerase